MKEREEEGQRRTFPFLVVAFEVKKDEIGVSLCEAR